jgi:hypothetical protein
MHPNLNNLPKTFTAEDKELIDFTIKLGGSIGHNVSTWAHIITDEKAVSTLNKHSLHFKKIIKASNYDEKVEQEYQKLYNMLKSQIENYRVLGMAPIAKLFESVDFTMIHSLAEFNALSAAHQECVSLQKHSMEGKLSSAAIKGE